MVEEDGTPIRDLIDLNKIKVEPNLFGTSFAPFIIMKFKVRKKGCRDI